MMKALILIGGLGTRLRPLTCNTPKSMLPLLNKPFLAYQVELIKKHGVKEIIFCLSYLPRSFRDYFGNGKKWGLKIHYVLEKDPLGTGGAVKNAQKYIDGTTLILNGDALTVLDIENFYKFHHCNKAKVSIVLTRVKDPTAYGLVETGKKGVITKFIEKPALNKVTCNTISAGIYLFEPDVLKYLPPKINYSLERGLFPHLLAIKEAVYGYISSDYWLDMGTIEKYLQAHFDILEGKVNYKIPGFKASTPHLGGTDKPSRRSSNIKNHIWKGRSAKISPKAEIRGKLVVGDNTMIHKYARIEGLVSIGNNCSIGQGVFLSDCVILDNVKIAEGAKLNKCLVDSNCRIEMHAVLNEGAAIGQGTVIKQYSRL